MTALDAPAVYDYRPIDCVAVAGSEGDLLRSFCRQPNQRRRDNIDIIMNKETNKLVTNLNMSETAILQNIIVYTLLVFRSFSRQNSFTIHVVPEPYVNPTIKP